MLSLLGLQDIGAHDAEVGGPSRAKSTVLADVARRRDKRPTHAGDTREVCEGQQRSVTPYERYEDGNPCSFANLDSNRATTHGNQIT